MKEHTAKTSALCRRQRSHAAIQGRKYQLLLGLGCLITALILSAAKLLDAPIPLAACMIAAFPPGLNSFSTAIGAICGYLLFTEGTNCAELVILSIMNLASVLVFQGTQLPGKIWFFPLMSAALWALLRGIGLSSAAQIPLWLLQIGVCGASTGIFRRTVAYGTGARLLSLGALLCALSSLPLSIDPGLLLATALCIAFGKGPEALVFGLAIDLTGGTPWVSIAFCVPTLTLQKLRKNAMPTFGLGFLILSSLLALLFATDPLASVFCLAAGTAIGLVLQRLPIFAESGSGESKAGNRSQARKAAHILRLLRQQLPVEAECPSESEAESVYDGAAEQVCRCCERFRHCWGDRIGRTCTALNSAAHSIILNGTAKAEDFPEEFRNHCSYLDGFVMAVNQELEGMLFRRQYRMRLQESRLVLAQELQCLEEYLLTPECPDHDSAGYGAYLPEIGLCSLGKNGATVNGDRSRRFYLDGRYYILLCDGMGSGELAAKFSAETISLLEQLLKSGMPPENALRLLNGVELLRGDDRFTTVDLLSIDLKNGEAELLKWGSAPSYFRSGNEVKKIGTATPPPGVGVGGEHSPDRYTLSLSGGELLVLRSDGACGEEIEEALRSYTGRSSVALAAYLISGISGEDDMTAITVSLRLHISS